MTSSTGNTGYGSTRAVIGFYLLGYMGHKGTFPINLSGLAFTAGNDGLNRH